jgi:hypothetical protein
MTDGSETPVVRVAEFDRTVARECLENLMNEANKLGEIISRTLGRDPVDLTTGFTLSLNTDEPEFSVSTHGVGLGILCNARTGECLGVYDDFLGVTRPCTASEASHCLQCGVDETDPQILPQSHTTHTD